MISEESPSSIAEVLHFPTEMTSANPTRGFYLTPAWLGDPAPGRKPHKCPAIDAQEEADGWPRQRINRVGRRPKDAGLGMVPWFALSAAVLAADRPLR
jgi:hypothetical protein